jgi:hypothetical protein
MSRGLGIQLAKARKRIKELEERVRDWESWFHQGHDNCMEEGDPYHVIFHDIDCPNKKTWGRDDCGECWLCETNRLTDNIHRSE